MGNTAWTGRAGVGPVSPRYAWVFGAIWLFYLLNPLGAIIDSSGWRRVVGLVSVSCFVVAYLIALAQIRRSRWSSAPSPQRTYWTLIAVLALCVLGMIGGAGQSALVGAPFVVAVIVMTQPVRVAVIASVVLFGVVEISSHLVAGWRDAGYGFGVVLAAIATFAIRLAFLRTEALVRAEAELAELALEEERPRIARDLHDILGHSLTVIAVKAELAERMVDTDPDRARAELADLQQLSRDALADVRATALGVRGLSLPNEIAQARAALESAGIEAVLPTATDEVPSRWRETFAWTIRECVTNVIRHSQAGRCVVEMTPGRLSVRDDGVGLGTQSVKGSTQGLEGLRQRVESTGAALRLSPGPDGTGLEVTVELPIEVSA